MKPNNTGHTSRIIVLIVLFSLLILGSHVIYAQIAGGMNETNVTRLGGNNYIVGTVFWPNGQPINRRMRIKLLTMKIGEILTETDDRGQFVFSGLPLGSYSVVIDREDEFESISQQIEIAGRSTIPQTYSVSIRLMDRIKRSAKASVINSERLGVPKKADDLFDDAVALSQEGDLKGAIEKLKKAIAEYPAFLDAYNELGVQYMQLGDLEKADLALREALKIKGNAFEPLLNLGITLFRQKRFDQAETEIRAALAVKAESATAYYYLGRTLTALSKFEESEKALNTALTLSGNKMNEAHRMLAQLFVEKGDLKRAVDELELYLRLVPEPPDKATLKRTLTQLKTAQTSTPK